MKITSKLVDTTVAVTFPGTGGQQLAARLELPTGRPRAFALFAHCFTCGKDLRAARVISRTLASFGLGVLRFDFTGIGESEGDFGDTTFSSNVDDLVAAADWLRKHHQAPQLLVGHSLGGAAVLVAAHRIDEVSAVATIGAPCRPSHVRKVIDAQAPELESDMATAGEVEVVLAGQSFRITRAFLEDLQEPRMREIIRGLGREQSTALLVCHSPVDDIVGVENAADIFTAAVHPKSFLSLDDADHLLRRRADAAYVAEMIGAWASRYIEKAPAPEVPHGYIEVRTGASFTTHIRTPRHDLVADEPERFGGQGQRAVTVRAAPVQPRRLYQHHPPLLRRPQRLAPGHRHRGATPSQDPRRRLFRVRGGEPGRSITSSASSGWKAPWTTPSAGASWKSQSAARSIAP